MQQAELITSQSVVIQIVFSFSITVLAKYAWPFQGLQQAELTLPQHLGTAARTMAHTGDARCSIMRNPSILSLLLVALIGCQHAAAQGLTKSQLEQRLAAFPSYSLYLQALQAVPDFETRVGDLNNKTVRGYILP
jgi:hypothetical protein